MIANDSPAWLILSDLDGTLLDPRTYSYDAAQEALDRVARLEIPLGLVSSKTRAEIRETRKGLGVQGPDVCENGAVILLPDGCIHRLGIDIATLRSALGDMARELGIETQSFREMGIDGVVADTGLPPNLARLALEREGDVPFTAAGVEDSAIRDAARARGLDVIRGDRYLHLMGHGGKGVACRYLLEWYADRGFHPRTIGIGNAANDAPLLELADIAVCIPREDGNVAPELLERTPDARVAPLPGPAGWNRAVLDILDQAGA